MAVLVVAVVCPTPDVLALYAFFPSVSNGAPQECQGGTGSNSREHGRSVPGIGRFRTGGRRPIGNASEEISMDTEQTDAPSTLGVAEAEAAVAQARATLDEARQVTKAAEEAYRARQADESAALAAYEQAAHRVRDAYAAERARIEEQMRTAEHELKALDARLSDLEVGGTSEPVSVEPVSARPAESGERETAERSAGRPASDPAAEGAEGAEGAAYEDDWYRTLKQRSENGSTPQGE